MDYDDTDDNDNYDGDDKDKTIIQEQLNPHNVSLIFKKFIP